MLTDVLNNRCFKNFGQFSRKTFGKTIFWDMGFRWLLLITINVCEKFDHYELIVYKIGVNGKRKLTRVNITYLR